MFPTDLIVLIVLWHCHYISEILSLVVMSGQDCQCCILILLTQNEKCIVIHFMTIEHTKHERDIAAVTNKHYSIHLSRIKV